MQGLELFRRELYFDHFVRFASGGLPLPVANCIRGSLRENGVAALNIDRLDAAIGSYERINLHRSCERQVARQRRIDRSRAIHQPAQ